MRPNQQTGKSAVEVIEEAFHLLREAPGTTLWSYYLGACPFVLGLLYFWSDMSRSAFAEQRLAPGALGLSLLFLWMKCAQAIFAQRVLSQINREPTPRWTLSRLARVAVIQAILQPSGLFLLPVAAIILIPLGWVYAFYQNVTVLGGDEDANLKTVFRKSCQQALLWPKQNHYVLGCFKLFGLFVFFNLVMVFLAVPYLLKTLLGVETPFVQSYWAVLNTTFFAAILSLAWLCLDPILRTVYVLRCFYGESLQTGQDLKVELRSFRTVGKRAAALFLLVGLLTAQPTGVAAAAEKADSAQTADVSGRRGAQPISPSQLDQAIERTIQQREYSWRLPREKSDLDKKRKGPIAAFFESIAETVKGWLKSVGRSLEKFIKWLAGKFRTSGGPAGYGTDWLSAVRGLFFVLIAGLLAALIVLLIRMWRRRKPPEEVTAQAAAPAPDLADESVGAEQLPEEGWLKLGRELLERGELRLALRAFYLASLAHLAQRDLISLARFKSNRDYERELGRRSHALPEVTGLFAQNVSVFDRVWYGLHEVNQEILQRFAQNVERIKAS